MNAGISKGFWKRFLTIPREWEKTSVETYAGNPGFFTGRDFVIQNVQFQTGFFLKTKAGFLAIMACILLQSKVN